jgi:prepilin-type N-terminal cleavage/methylation domain-containing protein
VPKRVLQAFTLPQQREGVGGFTLLELLIVIGVIAILAGIMFPVVSTMRARAQRVQCMSNLRNLHIAANLYVQQNGSWPQILVDSDDDDGQQDYARAWIAALAPFGLTQKAWICPTIQGLLQNPDYFQPENMRVDYYAMPFDDKPTTPYQWPRQPWFIETADVHGNGNLIIFTDGSISDLKTVLRNPGR